MAIPNAARGSLRVFVQLAAVAIVVTVPWLINLRLQGDATWAQQWVAHSAEVVAKVQAIRSEISGADRTLVWLAMTPENSELVVRHRAARKRVEEGLLELATLTSDNVEQLARAARMQALARARAVDADRVLDMLSENRIDVARELLVDTSLMMQLLELGDELVGVESRLLETRREDAARRERRYLWAMFAFAIIQVMLLAMIVVLSERQHRQRRRIEEQAQEVRARADVVFNSVRKPIAMLAQDLHIIMCNPAFRSLYADEAADLSGTKLELVGGGVWNDAALLQRLGDVQQFGRELWDYEVEQALPSGRRWLQVAARRIPGSEGRASTMILTANDITATRSAERQIRELNQALSDRLDQVSAMNRELEGFSYSVSHDLRAPLRHIAAFAMKLEREIGASANDKARQHLKIIADSAQRMGMLIDELLVHSRLGRAVLRPQRVSMAALVEEIRAMLDTEVADRRIEWRIGSLPEAEGDATTLRLVWQNLLSNAVKYTARRECAVIEVGGRIDEQRGEIVYRVADNGAGFDMAYADKLFGVFQRLHASDEFPGTGIGLANVRRIVVKHGGRVWAEAEPELGARFHFSLPIHALRGRSEQETGS